MTALLTFIMLQNCVKCWWSFPFCVVIEIMSLEARNS